MSHEEKVFLSLKTHRDEMWIKVLEGKLSKEDFVHGSFNFLMQNKFKPFVRAHCLSSVMFNYLYWQIHIERKIMLENQLKKYDLFDEDALFNVLSLHVKRRDQMVRRLLIEINIKIKDLYLVHKDMVELILESGDIIYCSQEDVEKARYEVKNIKKSAQAYYLSLIKF